MKKKAAVLLLCLFVILVTAPHVSATTGSPAQSQQSDDIKTTPPVILEQPVNGRAALGQAVTTTVLAEGDGLTYRWYYRLAGNPDFKASCITSASYFSIMTPKRCGMQLYCQITDRSGNSVRTQTVTLWGQGSFPQKVYKLKPNAEKSLAQELAFQTADPLLWESSNEAIVKVDDQGMITCLDYGYATITVRNQASHILAQCRVKVCDVIQVALTFDDGPSSHTPRLLDFLEDKDIKVTFFLVGNRMNYYSDIVQRIAEQGHEIAYHSYSHKTQTRLSSEQIISDYETSCEILASLVDTEFTLWRTPGGAYNDRVLNCIPLPHIMWSVDTRDWATLSSYRVQHAILNWSEDGSIVLLHDLHGTTVNGSIRAMEEMLEGDYEFITVSELLSRNGTPPEPCGNYFSG